MTSTEAQLATAKSEYEQQTEELFLAEGLFEDLDPPVVFRRGAAEYLLQLVAVTFRYDNTPDEAWTVWALAPVDRRWDAWAQNVARDRDLGWVDGLEHVWLTRAGTIQRALVHIHTGTILQPPAASNSSKDVQP